MARIISSDLSDQNDIRRGFTREELLKEATLYADFENGDYRLFEGVGGGLSSKAFGDVFDFTRGSDATGFGVSTLETVTTDVARFVYSPELKKRQGLQIEDSRTRLNTVAAAPTVAEDVTVTAAAHTISFYGAGEVALSGTATDTLTGTGDDERVELTFTPTAGTLTLTPSGNVVDLQLEVGTFATSVIRGEGSTQTRAADNCSRTLGAEFSASEGTFIFEGEFSDLNGAYCFDTNAASTIDSNRIAIFCSDASSGQLNFFTRGATPQSFTPAGFTVNKGEKFTAAISLNSSNKIAALNGSAVTGGYGGGSNPARLFAGSRFTNSFSNTKPYGIYYIPRTLSEAELIALTQPEAQ